MVGLLGGGKKAILEGEATVTEHSLCTLAPLSKNLLYLEISSPNFACTYVVV